MLQQGFGKGLLVAEGLYYLKLRADTWYTFNELYRILSANFGMSFRMVYEGLQHKLIFQRRKSTPRPRQRGARPYEYRIPHPDELEAEFAPGKGDTPSDTLQKADLRNLTTYRMGLHHQLYIRKWVDKGGKGFTMCRGLMADRLGVSQRTVRTYDQKLGHDHDPNFQEHPVTWHNWQQLPRYKNTHSPTGQKNSSKQWLRAYDTTTGQYQSYPLVKFLAYKALEAGLEVRLVERLPNTYYPYTRPVKSEFDSIDPVVYYLADQEARNAAGLYERGGQWYYRRE